MAGVSVAQKGDTGLTFTGGGRCPPNPPEYFCTEKAETGGQCWGWCRAGGANG